MNIPDNCLRLKRIVCWLARVTHAYDLDRRLCWLEKWERAEHECRRLEAVCKSRWFTDRQLNHAKHLADLETKVARLRHEVRVMQQAAERHNIEAYATGYLVHCTGCESGGPAHPEDLTEERVAEVELIARRLRAWWDNHQARKEKTE